MPINSINWNLLSNQQIVARLGKEVKRMRLERNLSQAEVAERAGLDRTTVGKLEAGRAATLLTVVQVLRALGKLELLILSTPSRNPRLICWWRPRKNT